jgi:hypothetical protein
MPRSIKLGIAVTAILVIWAGAVADDEKGKGHGSMGHVLARPDDVKWGPGPPGLPPGVQVAVIMGNPGKAEPYVLRAKMPDGYKVPPHWHPTTENVTVLHGTLMMGKGEKFDTEASEALPVGSFASMPKEMRHFAWAKGDTIIQIHGIGPFDITYVNPDDDPRKK